MSTIQHGEHGEGELKKGVLKNFLQGGARMARIENGAEEPHGPTIITLTTPIQKAFKPFWLASSVLDWDRRRVIPLTTSAL